MCRILGDVASRDHNAPSSRASILNASLLECHKALPRHRARNRALRLRLLEYPCGDAARGQFYGAPHAGRGDRPPARSSLSHTHTPAVSFISIQPVVPACRACDLTCAQLVFEYVCESQSCMPQNEFTNVYVLHLSGTHDDLELAKRNLRKFHLIIDMFKRRSTSERLLQV